MPSRLRKLRSPVQKSPTYIQRQTANHLREVSITVYHEPGDSGDPSAKVQSKLGYPCMAHPKRRLIRLFADRCHDQVVALRSPRLFYYGRLQVSIEMHTSTRDRSASRAYVDKISTHNVQLFAPSVQKTTKTNLQEAMQGRV